MNDENNTTARIRRFFDPTQWTKVSRERRPPPRARYRPKPETPAARRQRVGRSWPTDD